jgi:hypothetical protein
MKRNATRAVLAILLLCFVALELLYPAGPELIGETFRPDRSKYETVRDSFPAKTIEHFLNVAFRRERASSYHIRKWSESLRIRVLGTPSEYDSNALSQAVSELSPLIAPLEMALTERDPNVKVYFSHAAELPKYEASYVPGSEGTYWCWWSHVGEIDRCRIVIATDLTAESERSRTLRTFLLGVLGFMGSRPGRGDDSLLDKDRDPGPPEYSSLDRDLVRLLYRQEIYAGMSLRTARLVLIAP